MIVDLSYPSSRSVNDGINPDWCTLNYSSVNDVVRFVLGLGQGSHLVKVDLKSAYRLVLAHPLDRHLFGIQWGGHRYVDVALPFGLWSAPRLFWRLWMHLGGLSLRQEPP